MTKEGLLVRLAAERLLANQRAELLETAQAMWSLGFSLSGVGYLAKAFKNGVESAQKPDFKYGPVDFKYGPVATKRYEPVYKYYISPDYWKGLMREYQPKAAGEKA